MSRKCRALSFTNTNSGGSALYEQRASRRLCEYVRAYRPMGHFIAYSTTKGALIALTKSVAIHCANENLQIRCHSNHPGVLETDMIRGV